MCGIFGIANHVDAARLTKLGLFALQHRGQQSTGMASELTFYTGLGKVSFSGGTLFGGVLTPPFFWPSPGRRFPMLQLQLQRLLAIEFVGHQRVDGADAPGQRVGVEKVHGLERCPLADLRTHTAEHQEVSIQPATSNDIAPGGRHRRAAETCEQRACQEDRCPDPPRQPAYSTRPAPIARIGVPTGAAKSTPRFDLRAIWPTRRS